MFGLEWVPQNPKRDVGALKKLMRALGPDFLIVPDSPGGRATPEAIAVALMLQKRLKTSLIPSIAASGRREERVESLLLALRYFGMNKVALVGGDRPRIGDLSGAQACRKAKETLGKDAFVICGSSCILDKRTKKSLEAKIDAGCDLIITQPVFDAKTAQEFTDEFFKIFKGAGIEVMAGFFPIYEARWCDWINQRDLGFRISSKYRAGVEKDAKKTNLALWKDLQKTGINIHLCGLKNDFCEEFAADLVDSFGNERD